MAHVYLSYSRQDTDFIDLIEADLNERGHPVWRDTSNIRAHESWNEAIQNALCNAYAIVVAYSSHAAQSNWVAQEIQYAQENQIPIVLLVLEPCEVPDSVRDAPVIDFVNVQTSGGLAQLRYYRHALSRLVKTLDDLYPVRVCLMNLQAKDDIVREEAARQLGNLGDEIAVEALIQALGDPDVDVRFAAAEALGKLGSRTAVKPLIRVLEQDEEDPDVRAVAAVSLGAIGDSSAIQPLIRQLNHPDRFVRSDVALALGKLKANAGITALIHLMRNDPIYDVRQAATHALCMIGGPLAERALRRAGVDCAELENNN